MLFLDLGSEVGRRKSSSTSLQAVEAFLMALGRHLELVEVVLASPTTRASSLAKLRAGLPATLASRITGELWDVPPSSALGRYDHILYWLTRRHVWRLPTWLAVQSAAIEWPEQHQNRRVLVADSIASAATHAALRSALERYYSADLWWGEGVPPDAASRARAHSLMVAWSVPRRRWPEILGRSAREFEERLELLLATHAAAQRHVRAELWLPHWVQLPKAELDMRRPLEVIATEGLEGVRRVLDLVWARGH